MRIVLIVLAVGVVIAAVFIVESARIGGGPAYLPSPGQETAGPPRPDAGEPSPRPGPATPVEPVVLE